VQVGVNRFAGGEVEAIPVLAVDPELEPGQVVRTRAVRAERDAAAVKRALAAVRQTAEEGGNLLYPMKDALAAMATVGEVADVLRGVFGRYQPSR
jgi:methylmalonyl-CoA mutase N-terminal domain/subunit